MSSKVYLFRHGETEWSKNGRHTGKTDLPLTADGEERIKNSARRLLGADSLICPSHIARIYVSPRQRARRTLELLDLPHNLPVVVTERIAEWNYGAYEGLTSAQINARLNNQQGEPASPNAKLQAATSLLKIQESGNAKHDMTQPSSEKSSQQESTAPATKMTTRAGKPWNVFRDGCPDGDNAESVTKRVDALISDIRELHEAGHAEGTRKDVLIVAHGHILRSFAARWIGDPVQNGTRFAYGAGGAGVLAYEHGSLDEPTIEVWNGEIYPRPESHLDGKTNVDSSD